jgi:hypothetical protein
MKKLIISSEASQDLEEIIDYFYNIILLVLFITRQICWQCRIFDVA